MSRLRSAAIAFGLLAVLTAFWHLGLQGFPFAGPAPGPGSITKGVLTSQQEAGVGYLRYIPTSASPNHPLTVLVAIHGMGAKAEDFAAWFTPQTEANGWLLIVPRFTYGDWKQTDTLKAEDRADSAWLDSLMLALPGKLPFPIRHKVLVYGFSRGAQVAHRFALMYPERVLAVASMSAGTYTLPVATSTPAGGIPLEFPVGVADLQRYCGKPFDPASVRQVSFWIGVGDRDNSPGDVPQSWDQYIGDTRVERAKAFAKAMENLGAPVRLEIIPGLGHGESAQSRADSLAFLRQQESAPPAPLPPTFDALEGEPSPAPPPAVPR